MLQPRYYHGAATVNGKLYVFGGSDGMGSSLATVEAYDPVTNTWTSRAPMPTARDLFGIAVANGIIYVIGGHVYGGNPSVLSTVVAYNPATNTWTTAPSMPTARYSLSAGEINGVIYAVGGIDPDSIFLDTVEAFTAPPPQVSPPTSKDQCDNDGWRGFSVPRSFKNQGDCNQFVNKGK
ncbi:MAG TPA: kelch repeat-containing protein [Pyrinomonadaceae bacterium]|nr:kelch repeat-containing protein [Pyrinomonadaceae bacterium]